MFRFLFNRATRAMQKRYNYDTGYMREVASVSSGAGLRLALLPLFSQYRAGAPIDLWAGAAAASTLDGDCGPCLQLVVDMALERGADSPALRAALQGDFEAAGAAGLGFRFARAAITGGLELDALRDEVRHAYGQQAVISLSISAATCRTYPVIKRGLGYGAVCQFVLIDQIAVDIAQPAVGSMAAAT